MKTKAIGAPQVSPDGKRVVYTVNEAVMTADKRMQSNLDWFEKYLGTSSAQK